MTGNNLGEGNGEKWEVCFCGVGIVSDSSLSSGFLHRCKFILEGWKMKVGKIDFRS